MKRVIDTWDLSWEDSATLKRLLGRSQESGLPHYVIIEAVEED